VYSETTTTTTANNYEVPEDRDGGYCDTPGRECKAQYVQTGTLDIEGLQFPSAMALSPDARLLAVTSESQGCVWVVDVSSSSSSSSPRTPTRRIHHVRWSPLGVAFTPGGDQLIVSSRDQGLSAVSLATGRRVRALAKKVKFSGKPGAVAVDRCGHILVQDRCKIVLLSPDGEMLGVLADGIERAGGSGGLAICPRTFSVLVSETAAHRVWLMA
jgi:WD40 repeat protein